MDITVKLGVGEWIATIKGDRRKPRPVGTGSSWQAAVRALVEKVREQA
jgi:hypothetical protein